MLSNKVPVDTVIGKSVNMFWDGVFHLFCFIVVFTGIVLLWKLLFRKDIRRSKALLGGGMLLGWGLFNVVEGIIDHHLLRLHLVKQNAPDPEVWNVSFLAVSAIMILVGALMVYRKSHERIVHRV